MKFITVFLWLVFLSPIVKAQKPVEIILAADYWCPFNCQPQSSQPGYMIEVAQRIFAQHNIKVNYQIIPWSRALKMCRKGEIAAVVGGYQSDAPDFIYPTIEQGMIGFSFFSLRNMNWRYLGLTSLEDKRLAIAYDYAYSAELGSYIKKNQANKDKLFIAYGDQPLKKNIQLLERDLVDVIIETEPVFWYVSKQINKQHLFRQAGKLQSAQAAYIAFSPAIVESQHYAEILSQGMQRLRESGELASILAKYGLTDWRIRE